MPELLRIFDFKFGGRPPSWIWYDVTTDHPRLVFDGLNIVLKLHVDRFYTLKDIAIFIFVQFGLKLPFGKVFRGYYPKLIPILSKPPKGPSLGENASFEP